MELENFSIKLQSAEREHASTHRDLTSLRSQVDRLKTEKGQLEQELFETQQSYSLLQSEYSKLEDNLKKTHDLLQKDRSDNAHIVEELTKEVFLYFFRREKYSKASRYMASSYTDLAGARF